MWTIDEAQKLISNMQGLALHCNFNLGLAGSVLNDGYSNKDLDIFCFPRSKKFADRNGLLAEMTGVIVNNGGFDITLNDIEENGWSDGPGLDGRKVITMQYKFGTKGGLYTDKKIDWIFVDYGE